MTFSENATRARISSWCYLFSVTLPLSSNHREAAKSQCWDWAGTRAPHLHRAGRKQCSHTVKLSKVSNPAPPLGMRPLMWEVSARASREARGCCGWDSPQTSSNCSFYPLNASNALGKVPFQLFHLKYSINCSRLISPGRGMDYQLHC